MPKAFEAALNFGLSITGTRASANGRVVDYSDQQALSGSFPRDRKQGGDHVGQGTQRQNRHSRGANGTH